MRQRLERTGLEPLEFDGELISSAEPEPIELGGDTAKYCLFVYRQTKRREDGLASGFVASIRYSRTGEHERCVNLSEELETNQDVENFFFVFEPEEYCSKQELTNNRGLDQDELLRKLYGYYNEQVQSVIAQLRALEGVGNHAVTAEHEGASESHGADSSSRNPVA